MPLKRRYCNYLGWWWLSWLPRRAPWWACPPSERWGRGPPPRPASAGWTAPRCAAATQARDLRRHKHVTYGDTSTWPAATQARDPRRHKHVTRGDTSTWPAATQARDPRRHKHVTCGDTSTWPAATEDLEPKPTKRYGNTEGRTIWCGTVQYSTLPTQERIPRKKGQCASVADFKMNLNLHLPVVLFLIRRNLYKLLKKLAQSNPWHEGILRNIWHYDLLLLF